ncbi:hypothetical protein, variant [Aphanomyces astaci]|nr:hypothetical protein, variant [Aphanomyces astaci]ETV76451.1 hypothetical protein, variant [Aphanomyces astaci]|eukprot:XP_009833996.1 hypothetical protein, variant [Aphanomyces astaci]
MVHELIDPASYALRDCNRVNPHAIATAVHDLLGCMLPSGSWESSNAIVVRVLQLDGSTSTRYSATQAAVAYLDRVVAADSRWWTNPGLRGRTMTWLARHEEDTHFADLQALLLRLHISFDGVAPLMRLRLDPLVHSVRSLVLDAVVTMDSASLLPCLEWLRELTPPRWRVLASPIGVHPTMTTQAQVQVYLAKLSHFTLVPELCEFCNNHSVVDKQDLLVFIHTLSPLELGHFRETLQRPTHKFATAPGVKVAVAFYTSLSAMQRLEMKSQLHAILRETKANPPIPPNKGTPVPSLNKNVLHWTRSRPRRRQKSPACHHRRPLAPLLRPTMSAPSISLDSSSLAPMVVIKPHMWSDSHSPVRPLLNGDIFSPPKSAVAAAWSKSPLSHEKLHFEATYFDAPSISRHRLEFCPPQHVKHFSLPKVNERHVCDMNLDPTWVSPVDLTGVLD